ncbi:hypothetical protein IW262DRAFT_1302767 [Armillaria fumosa]|nr:hypothetical protein IW262DRAFT_1302767 [Armillaria fumosa]
MPELIYLVIILAISVRLPSTSTFSVEICPSSNENIVLCLGDHIPPVGSDNGGGQGLTVVPQQADGMGPNGPHHCIPHCQKWGWVWDSGQAVGHGGVRREKEAHSHVPPLKEWEMHRPEACGCPGWGKGGRRWAGMGVTAMGAVAGQYGSCWMCSVHRWDVYQCPSHHVRCGAVGGAACQKGWVSGWWAGGILGGAGKGDVGREWGCQQRGP